MHIRRDGFASSGGFDNIGSDTNQSEHLSISDYISYDEMLIGALLGVSCPSVRYKTVIFECCSFLLPLPGLD
jgi:hypothetical protein